MNYENITTLEFAAIGATHQLMDFLAECSVHLPDEMRDAVRVVVRETRREMTRRDWSRIRECMDVAEATENYIGCLVPSPTKTTRFVVEQMLARQKPTE